MKVFMSYRREDSRGHADHLYCDLRRRFGRRSVFRDLDSIEPGDDFEGVLRAALARCNAVLVVIGKGWLDIRNKQGKRRLDDPADLVLMEVRAALKRHVRVIPILVNEATMPAEGELPPSLSSLCDHHAITITDNHWHTDVKRLKRRLGVPTRIKFALALGSVALLIAGGLALLGNRDQTSVTLIRPIDSTLAYGEEVEVDVRRLHRGEVVWFLTQGAKDQDINRLYQPTPEPERSTGNRWVRDVYAGDADQKKVFHIHVVAANSDARQVFLNYSMTAAATGKYPGFKELPVGARRIASFTVTRT